MLVKAPAEYPAPDEDKASNEVLLYEPESSNTVLPRTAPSHVAVLFCTLPGQVRHLLWWLTKFSADHLDIFYMYGEMGNND